MKLEDRLRIKEKIQEAIAVAEKDIASLEELTRPIAPDNAIGRLTRMEAINSRSVNQASLAKARQTLKDLNKSLASMDDPGFGYCMRCEEPISLKRLMIVPETALCVSYAGKGLPNLP